MTVSGLAFFVFLVPVVGSLLLGTLVLGEALKDPNRELNMLPFQEIEDPKKYDDSIQIINLEEEYLVSTPIHIQVYVSDFVFDCGDLYISIYDTIKKQISIQKEFFGQCFEKNKSLLPIGDEFNEIIDVEGSYQIEIKIIDKHGEKSGTINKSFRVN